MVTLATMDFDQSFKMDYRVGLLFWKMIDAAVLKFSCSSGRHNQTMKFDPFSSLLMVKGRFGSLFAFTGDTLKVDSSRENKLVSSISNKAYNACYWSFPLKEVLYIEMSSTIW